MKIGPKIDDAKAFGDPAVYNIKFGPGKCEYNTRTHMIFNYKVKHFLKTVTCRTSRTMMARLTSIP